MYTKTAILNYVAPFYVLNQELMEYFQLLLLMGDVHDELFSYVQKRGFSKDMLELFRIGYCPDGQTMYDFATSRGWKDEDLQELGFWFLLENKDIIVKFENRLLFPFSEVDGTVHGFSGRVLHDEKVQDKYINTNNCLIYNKSILVYGLREALICNSTITRWILVEGTSDVLSLFQAGYTMAVAGSGTAITEKHLFRLSQYCKNFVIMFDNDDAGKKATVRVVQTMKDLHLNWKIAILQDTKDADQAIREGKAHLIERALTTG